MIEVFKVLILFCDQHHSHHHHQTTNNFECRKTKQQTMLHHISLFTFHPKINSILVEIYFSSFELYHIFFIYASNATGK